MSAKIGIRNPQTGQVDCWIQPLTFEQLTEQCVLLRTAQSDWLQINLARRIQALQEWKQALSLKDDLIQALIIDTLSFI